MTLREVLATLALCALGCAAVAAILGVGLAQVTP